MATVAVITAYNPALANPGMVSVDLGFSHVLGRLYGGTNARWFTLQGPDVAEARPYADVNELPFAYRPLQDNLDLVYRSDAVVIWGDFLQAYHYLVQDATDRMLRSWAAADRARAKSMVIEHLLLAEAPAEVLKRTILFGGTILYNTQSDYLDQEYRSAFERLVRTSRRIWMREPLSAAKIAIRRGDGRSSCLGVDAALLVERGDLDCLATSDRPKAIGDKLKIGIFVGARTPIPSGLTAFCRGVAARLGAGMEWIPWLMTSRRHLRNPAADALRSELGLDKHEHEFTLGDLLSRLEDYAVIITDTYHFAVNAWRTGTPAICIAQPQPARDETRPLSLSDAKKHVFYGMYEANDFLLVAADFEAGAWWHTAERVCKLMRSDCPRQIEQRIHDHVRQVRDDFVTELCDMLT